MNYNNHDTEVIVCCRWTRCRSVLNATSTSDLLNVRMSNDVQGTSPTFPLPYFSLLHAICRVSPFKREALPLSTRLLNDHYVSV